MDFYMIVWIDPEDASHLGSPEIVDTKSEGEQRLRELKQKHPEKTHALYGCEEILATDKI